MPYHLLVTSPNDQCFVGPFDTKEAADSFHVDEPLDVWVMDDNEKAANIADYGVIGSYTPTEFMG